MEDEVVHDDMAMARDSVMRRFQCCFKSGNLGWRSIAYVLIAVYGIIIVLLGITNCMRIGVMLGLLCLAIPFAGMYCTRKFVRNTWVEISSDGVLSYISPFRKPVCYPVNEIIWVMSVEVGADGKLKCHYQLPVAVGHGVDIFSERGVLIGFNRKYWKSSLPLFVNPSDPEALIAALVMVNPAIEVMRPIDCCENK